MKYSIPKILATLIIIAFVGLGARHAAFAAHENNTNENDTRNQNSRTLTAALTDAVLPSATPDAAPVAAPNEENTAPIAPRTSTTTPEAPTSQTASTTPATNTSTVRNGDPVNKNVEDILNTPTAQPKPTPITPKATKKATTTPLISGTTNTPKDSADNSNQPTNQTTEAFTRDTDGTSNQSIGSNYYIPLDTLSPSMTYSLSFIAMLLGITGAVLILRDTRESIEWVPGITGQESLLDLEP